jgi:hypothetical protein
MEGRLTDNATPKPLRIAIAGLGTVGAGVIRLLDTNRALIAARAGRGIEVVAVSARDRGKDRGVDIARFAWEDDMTALARRDDVDVVVELVGGADGLMIANLITSQFGTALNWPLGSALSMFLLFIVLIIIELSNRAAPADRIALG